MVRLGLPCDWPVSLLQWDSALAVNYPARAMGIVRGDSFVQIQQKSASYCRQQQQQNHNKQTTTEAVALHLPILSVLDEESPTNQHDDNSSLANNNDVLLNDSECSIEAAYDKEFRLSEETRKERFAKEKNRMRQPHEGKASLERYRLASSRIFSVILEALNDHVGKAGFVLERASIDELYVDVTDHCNDDSRPVWAVCNGSGGGGAKEEDGSSQQQQQQQPPCSIKEVMGQTVVCASDALQGWERTANKNDAPLERGCVVARMVRKAVWDALGFTLSAGISTSKTVAKLAASYGKPNGQAVVLPAAIPIVMERTKVRKVRNFARKLGKQVLSLLPENEDTMGAVARLLSLDMLVTGMGSEATAKFVFDACRGIDDEPVKETSNALTKSITAFKSFGGTDLVGMEKWIVLLASDIAARIDLDSKRNHRYPKHCSIHYTSTKEGTVHNKDRISRSIRIPFPSARISGDNTLRQQLVKQVRTALEQKAHFPMFRLGLCAMEFETRALNGGIGSFFSTGSDTKCTKPDNSHQHASHSIGDGTHAPSSTAMNTNMSRNDKKKDTGPIGAYFSTAVLVPTNHNDDPSNARLSSYTNTVEPKNIFLSESQVSPNNHEADTIHHEDLETEDEYLIKNDEEIALKLQQECDREHLDTQKESAVKDEHDIAYAQKLQASFDQENRLLSTLERSSKNSSPKRNATAGHRRSSSTHKKARIDTYFTLKK